MTYRPQGRLTTLSSSLNVLNAEDNYPILTFCPASGQQGQQLEINGTGRSYNMKETKKQNKSITIISSVNMQFSHAGYLE